MCKRTSGTLLSFMAIPFLACLILGAAAGQRAFAQAPDGPVQGHELKRIYTNKKEFHLPVKLPDEKRVLIREMCLYVKSAQFDWSKQDSIVPTAVRFTYQVPQDGEYFFTVVTVDKTGQATPADVHRAQPGLRVVVDTQPPQFDVRAWVSQEGETFLRCSMIDANPNPDSIRVTFRNSAGAETLAECHNNQPGLFRVTGPDSVPVRVVGTDLAGNSAFQTLNARELLGEKFTAQTPPIPAVPNAGRPDLQPPPANLPPVGPITSAGYTPPPIPASKPGDLPVVPVLPTISDNLPKIPAISGGPTTIFSAPAGNRQIIRSPQANVEYRVDGAGSSGVGKVEVYITADEGQTWKRVKEDVSKRSPVSVELPGEGVFGISVAVTNGNGFGGTPPKRGEHPAFSVEVDATSPFVQLRPIEASAATAGTVEIRWTATDKNLTAEPIHLYYRTRQEGTWQNIAHNVKNDGVHRWSIPRDIGNQFYFKVEAVDQAGNIGRAETPGAVIFDMSEPHGIILGVTSATPQGN